MPTNNAGRQSLSSRADSAPDVKDLFRHEALRAASEPLHGVVTIVMPPGVSGTVALCLLALTLLALAAFVVEVPQRAPAVGVLMPPDGFLHIVASEPGRVTDVRVRERQVVAVGEPLLTLGSDRSAVDRAPLSASQIRSLQTELQLQRRARLERERLQASLAMDVMTQLAGVNRRLVMVQGELEHHRSRLRILESRRDRLERLAADGNVSQAQFDEAKLDLLQAKASSSLLQRQAAGIAEERDQLLRRRRNLAQEASLQRIDAAIASESLKRQVATLEAIVNRHLQAPQEAVVARISVRPGQFVQTGQTLLTLHRKGDVLEAWLYLSSASAGRLYRGQEVELRLDAYPHQMFGTQSATVTSISNMALLPGELDIPLALGGPVFEVRAALERQYVQAQGRRWPLIAGTSFRADLVQQRYRLYEWLLRLRRRDSGTSDPEPGRTDA